MFSEKGLINVVLWISGDAQSNGPIVSCSICSEFFDALKLRRHAGLKIDTHYPKTIMRSIAADYFPFPIGFYTFKISAGRIALRRTFSRDISEFLFHEGVLCVKFPIDSTGKQDKIAITLCHRISGALSSAIFNSSSPELQGVIGLYVIEGLSGTASEERPSPSIQSGSASSSS